MDGGLFCLGGDVTTRSDDDERVRFAVRVLEIEPAKEDRRCRCDSLAEGHSLAYSCYNWSVSVSVFRDRGWEGENGRTVSSEDVEKVKEQRVFHITHVLCSRLPEGCAVDDPSLAFEEDVRECMCI